MRRDAKGRGGRREGCWAVEVGRGEKLYRTSFKGSVAWLDQCCQHWDLFTYLVPEGVNNGAHRKHGGESMWGRQSRDNLRMAEKVLSCQDAPALLLETGWCRAEDSRCQLGTKSAVDFHPLLLETLWWDDVITHHRLLALIRGGSQNKTLTEPLIGLDWRHTREHTGALMSQDEGFKHLLSTFSPSSPLSFKLLSELPLHSQTEPDVAFCGCYITAAGARRRRVTGRPMSH